MHRYWEIKSKNFDKIVFYRFGKWFIVYYQDAHICNKLIDLCIPPRQTHKIVGFHETHLEDNVEILCNSGYKVAICEQTENSKQMNSRTKKNEDDGGDNIKAVRREVQSIYTIGTHFKKEVDPSNYLGNYDTKNVLAFY